jgi:hypothetical protein
MVEEKNQNNQNVVNRPLLHDMALVDQARYSNLHAEDASAGNSVF